MPMSIPSLLGGLSEAVEKLTLVREIVLANAVMCGEIPAPTGNESKLVRFLCDRFTESQLLNVSSDEAGNAIGLLPGKRGNRGKNILLASHTDRIWETGVDHTIQVNAATMVGPGIADNSLGVAAIASMPVILERLGVELENNLILVGASRSMGHGDLGGLRFFVENTQFPIDGAVCVEGIQLGRLSYSCLGMNRGEIIVRTPEEPDWQASSRSGAIVEINRIVHRILSIPTPEEPRTSIILGSIMAGTGFNTPPTEATLRFEVRSETPGMVAAIREQIEEIIAEVNAERDIQAEIRIIARRKPGSIGFSHPLVKGVRGIMEHLEIEAVVEPSISELSVLLDHEIPSVTLGVTTGDNKHALNETIHLPPMFRGLAQIAAAVQMLDAQLSEVS
jgi:acetylornithine deacetylase/succinyl-diaminopimelate desuccinylase-like protein